MKKLLLLSLLIIFFNSQCVVVDDEPAPNVGQIEVYKMTAFYGSNGWCTVAYPHNGGTIWVPAGTPLEDFPQPYGPPNTQLKFYRAY